MRHQAAGKRRDANEGEIVECLRKAGATVELLSGKDIPDLLVGFRGQNFLFEVKNRDGYDTVSLGQKMWSVRWNGQVATIHDATEALQIIMARRTG